MKTKISNLKMKMYYPDYLKTIAEVIQYKIRWEYDSE
jgi:hypothetical protein